ncbi:helix-turn-helix transcriptional regulator [Nocardia sp. NPDC004085]|uniref:helix-turn-helix transcriptional regulator n=1 Tax=Nocardia sp. NPDC019255 TaxID=3154591 RepID=UPI0033E81030
MSAPTHALLTPAETAARLRIHPQTLINWRGEGRGPRSFKIGRRRFYDECDVDAWILEQKRASA